MKKIKFTAFLGFFLFFACGEKKSDAWSVSIPKDLKMIGHKGSGTINEFGNAGLIENTWASIKNAIENTDGSEIDLQLSSDSTLWIFHDHELKDCNDSLKNFFSCTDEQIRSISACNFHSQMLTLDEFVLKAKGHDWENKLLSLDLKMLYNPTTVRHFGDSERLANFVAKSLESTLIELKMEVLLEVMIEEQYEIIHRQLPYKTFLVNYQLTKDFLQETKRKRTALSIPIELVPEGTKFTAKDEVQLWTINSADQFFKAINFAPGYIQSDNIPLMKFFKQIQQGQELLLSDRDSISIAGSALEYYSLMEIPLENRPYLVKFTPESFSFPKEVLLVMSVDNNHGENIFWQGLTLENDADRYFFVDSEYLKAKGGKAVSFHIWNKGKSQMKVRGKIETFVL